MLRGGKPVAQDQGWAVAARSQGASLKPAGTHSPIIACIMVSILAAV